MNAPVTHLEGWCYTPGNKPLKLHGTKLALVSPLGLEPRTT
jgi:hypothetical protein